MTDRVRDQYEAYPYPERDPADEKKRLIVGSPSDVREIDHFLYGGRRDWKRPFRALVAGGGTGDALVMLAQQLADRGCPADLHYIDISQASAGIARARIMARGLGKSVAFHRDSLLEAGKVAPGPYDYIDCNGVLHHLDDPAAGLRALAALVAPDGGMGLMVYGELGRTGVYDVQALLRALCADAPDAGRLGTARSLLRELPATNRLRRNTLVGVHLAGGDAGLYDLLLHGRDRAYRVPELVELVDGAGLGIVSFIEPARYEPATYLSNPMLLAKLRLLSLAERAAFAELLAGNMKTHVCYVAAKSRAASCAARPGDPGAVPYGRDVDFPALARGMAGAAPSATFDGLTVKLRLPPSAPAILALADGKRSLGDIQAAMNPAMDWAGFLSAFRVIFAAFNGINRMLLRYPVG
ncbi:MAG: class I SAM-dependent methyltransferase [Rhodospirillales bacterium]